jgi:hypothetical protein
VTQEHAFMIMDKEQTGISVKGKRDAMKAVYVPPRGLICQLGSFTPNPRLIYGLSCKRP